MVKLEVKQNAEFVFFENRGKAHFENGHFINVMNWKDLHFNQCVILEKVINRAEGCITAKNLTARWIQNEGRLSLHDFYMCEIDNNGMLHLGGTFHKEWVERLGLEYKPTPNLKSDGQIVGHVMENDVRVLYDGPQLVFKSEKTIVESLIAEGCKPNTIAIELTGGLFAESRASKTAGLVDIVVVKE